MRAVVQRVLDASVSVNQETVGQIGPGLLVYLCAEADDTRDDMVWTAEKIIKMKLFPDSQERMAFPLTEVAGSVLVVSQFTLCAKIRKGNKPNFNTTIAPPQQAEAMVNDFIAYLAAKGIQVQSGQFAAMMKVQSTNDGPVTIIVDSKREVR